MTSSADNYWAHGGRHDRNALSLVTADHNRDHWSMDEIDLLLTWDRTEEELTTMGEILGRTREACRNMYYVTIRSQSVDVIVTRRPKRDASPLYSNWSEEDRCPWYV